MRISKKTAYNVLMLFLKLFPVIVLAIGYINGTLSIVEMSSWWSSFGFTSDIVDFLGRCGFTMGTLGTAMIGYFNYLVMFHLLECLIGVLLFLPEVFISLLDKIKGNGEL